MNTEHDLRSALRRGAASLAEDQPLTFDAVKGRARTIRRRRAVVAGVAAVAVVAVAVPLGLSFTDSTVSGPEIEPAAPTETVEPPTDPTGVLLTTDRPLSAEQSLTTATVGSINPPDGADPVSVEAHYLEVVPLGTGWVAMRSEGYGVAVDVVSAAGDVEASYPADELGLAVSRDGTVVAWVGTEGRVMTLAAGEEARELYRDDGPGTVGAVTGSGSCDPGSAGGGCAVHVNRVLPIENFTVDSTGTLSEVSGVLHVTSLAEDGRVAGVTQLDSFSSCSAVLAGDGERRLWRTCDYTDLRFSPSGQYVMGIHAQTDGAGSPSLAILDADDGEVLARVANDSENPAFVSEAEWNDVDEVLMTVYEGESGHVMRLTPDGVYDAVIGGEYEITDPSLPDLHLETRP